MNFVASGTALLAGLSGCVFTALFFALVPSPRAKRDRGKADATDHAHFWQMLLRKGGQAVAVLDGAGTSLFLCGKAEQYLDACRAEIGPALANLTGDGIGFDLKFARNATEHLRITGRPVGRRAVLYFTQQTQDSAAEIQLRREVAAHSALIRKLPVAVAAFTADHRLWDFSSA